MAPTTFEELVDQQGEVSAALTKTTDEANASSAALVERFGGQWGDDLEGLRWRARSVQKYGELSKKITANDAEVRRTRVERVQLRRTRLTNMEEHEEMIELAREAAASDPWVRKGLKEIVDALSGGVDAEVLGVEPDFEVIEKSIGECCRDLGELREEMSRKYESEIAHLETRLLQSDAHVQALRVQVKTKDEEAGIRQQAIGARDARIADLSQRNGRLEAAVATRDARIAALDGRVALLTGDLGAANARVGVLSGQVEKLWKGVAESRRTSGERLAEREEALQSLGARDARIQGLEARGGELAVDVLWGSCPLVGLNPRDVVAEGGTLLAAALKEWQRNHASEGKSLAECVRGRMGPAVPTLDGPSLCGHGDSLVVIGDSVLVVPDAQWEFGDGESEWVTVEYGNPRVVLRVANGDSGPLDNMFPAAMARFAAAPLLRVSWA